MESMAGPSSDSSITYLSSVRGNKILVFNDRQFSKVKEYKNGSILWRCLKRACKGYLTVTCNDTIHKQTAHSCSPCGAEVEVRKALEECRHIAATTCTPIPTLYKNTISKLESKGLNLLTNLPSYNRLKSGLYQHRNRARDGHRPKSCYRSVKRNRVAKTMSGGMGNCGDEIMGTGDRSYPDHRAVEMLIKDPNTSDDYGSYKNEYDYMEEPQGNDNTHCCDGEPHYGETVTHELLRMQIKMKQESMVMKKEFYSTCIEEMRKQTSLLEDIARHVGLTGAKHSQVQPCTNHYQQL